MKFLFRLLLCIGLCTQSGCTQEKAHNPETFDLWLMEFKQDAATDGISQDTLNEAFAETVPLDRVIELDRKQPESTLTLDEYLGNVLTNARINEGKRQLSENQELLKKIGDEYGVQPKYIVALWGIETNYGKNTGGFKTIDALATLAYDGRRADYFRGELLKALHILQDNHMTSEDMKGSWAGALGQCQFMPTTFLRYAVDYDHDGKRDIWEDKADVFASIANYLKSLGWDRHTGWGFKVMLPENFDRTLADIKSPKSMEEWQKLGVTTEGGGALPENDMEASLILVGEGDDAVPYIVYPNYRHILEWNRSRFFATAVGTLADNIAP